MRFVLRMFLGSCGIFAAEGLSAPTLEWADWVEPDFPFFSSTIDARGVGEGFPADNLTPRGLVLNLGNDYWVGFDTDLVRVAAIWRGQGISPRAMAPASYNDPAQKPPPGQFPAPEPLGKVWLANGIYPGWQTGAQPHTDDPREPAPSPEEVGRGALTEGIARFKAVRLVNEGAVLEYTANGAAVREWITASNAPSGPRIERHFHLAPSGDQRLLLIGFKSEDTALSLQGPPGLELQSTSDAAIDVQTEGDSSADPEPNALWFVRIPPHANAVSFCITATNGKPAPKVAARPVPFRPPGLRWPQEVVTSITLSKQAETYVVDQVALPLKNPWRRNIRLSDIQFLDDGTGVGVTVDGDVWLIRGLHEATGKVRWRRFASGLHEPMSLAIRDDEIFVFDRGGIWHLQDTDGNGEADVHELFSNVFAQTADMREFPATIRVAPGGEFVIAKGGQAWTTLGKHNGSVLRISSDGARAKLLGYGFRQPSIGVNVRTGLVTSSDQQGQYVPTTPIHDVRDGQFYGFLSTLVPAEAYPASIAEPITWIPYDIDASGISFAWLFGARMGPLNESLVHIAFNQPELFRVLLNSRGKELQGAVASITSAFDIPLLNGSVNPADGQLYIAGFQILGWEGTRSTRVSGLARVRYTGGKSTLPRDLIATDKGILVRFDVELDRSKATDPVDYSLASWNYRRTKEYGSPQFKADGTPGVDWLTVSSAYLSDDRKGIFVGVPDMKPAMQMRLGWKLATDTGTSFVQNAYFTPRELLKFDPVTEGFGKLSVDLSPRRSGQPEAGPVSVEEGRRLYELFGCFSCHATEETTYRYFKTAPTFKGLYGRKRTFHDGQSVIADEAYLRESILDPTAKITPGYEDPEVGMPSFSGMLSESQVDSLIQFIKSLQ